MIKLVVYINAHLISVQLALSSLHSAGDVHIVMAHDV